MRVHHVVDLVVDVAILFEQTAEIAAFDPVGEIGRQGKEDQVEPFAKVFHSVLSRFILDP